jgi:hypothetical protein
MQIIDFFRFPTILASEGNLFKLKDELFKQFLEMDKHPIVNHEMLALFDSRVVKNKNQIKLIKKSNVSGNCSFAYMPTLDEIEGIEQLGIAAEIGCKAVVFHPYLQKINTDKLGIVRLLASYAEKRGMFSCICASYGSKDIYNISPLEVVVTVAESIQAPVVIVHGGGSKVLEAFLIAEAFPNIYLDTSFSLNYWLESPLEDAFAFAIRRLGADRWMFGSDAPFRDLNKTIESHMDFCHRYGFTNSEISSLMHGTASKLLGI